MYVNRYRNFFFVFLLVSQEDENCIIIDCIGAFKEVTIDLCFVFTYIHKI